MLERAHAIVLALAVGLVPIAPPEHVHEAAAGADHHSVSHRHARLHTATHADGLAHTGAAFDDDDGSIVVLDAVSTASHRVFQVTAQALATAVQPQVDTYRVPPPAFVEHVIHGPPRAHSSPRAPPNSPTL